VCISDFCSALDPHSNRQVLLSETLRPARDAPQQRMSEKACREPARSSTSSASTSSDDSEESLLSDVDETLPSQAAFDVFALLGDAQRNRAEWCVASRKAARWIASWAVCHVLFRTDTSQELLLRAFIQLEADLVTAKVSQVNSIAWPILGQTPAPTLVRSDLRAASSQALPQP
jgi:hypothetical protein